MTNLHLSAEQAEILSEISEGTINDEEIAESVNVVVEYLDHLREAKTVGERREALEEIKCYAESAANDADYGLAELQIFDRESDSLPLDAWKQAHVAKPASAADDQENNK
jgi:hypothetical protein